jgi:hypothetical protein
MKNEKTPKALVESLVKEAVAEVMISESVKEGVKHKVGSKEVEFGSAEHIRILKGVLHVLQGLRDCYQTGSANRHVYASACHKLRKLIAKHAPSGS